MVIQRAPQARRESSRQKSCEKRGRPKRRRGCRGRSRREHRSSGSSRREGLVRSRL